MLCKELATCYYARIPITKKVISVKHKRKPWITLAIETSMKMWHHFISLYKKNKMSENDLTETSENTKNPISKCENKFLVSVNNKYELA